MMDEMQNKFVNFLGEFNNIDEVWERYPEGGHEGDYITIAGEQLAWNKYTRQWGDESTPSESTPKISEVLGSLIVERNLTIGGTLRAQRVDLPDKGLYPTIEALRQAIPFPEVGYWAAVGNTFPAELWVCAEQGVWSHTHTTYNGGDVDLTDYASSENLLTEAEYEAIPEKEDRFYFTYEE
jgi:hypothetical protein